MNYLDIVYQEQDICADVTLDSEGEIVEVEFLGDDDRYCEILKRQYWNVSAVGDELSELLYEAIKERNKEYELQEKLSYYSDWENAFYRKVS